MWREVVTLVQRTTWDMWPRERDSFRGRHITSFWWRGGGGGGEREGGREGGGRGKGGIRCATGGIFHHNKHPYKCTTYDQYAKHNTESRTQSLTELNLLTTDVTGRNMTLYCVHYSSP